MDNGHSSPRLTNCTFTANSATDQDSSGGGMCNDFSSPTLTNCTFTANLAGEMGGGMRNYSSSPRLTNCILWANEAPSDSEFCDDDSRTPVVTYSDIQGGYSGAGNINLDPHFVRNPSPGPDGQWRTADDDYGDLRLRPFSPAVDAGNKGAVPAGIGSDLAGSPRFADVPTVADTGLGQAPIVDLGAYEAAANVDAEAGGPYAVPENGQVTLHGQGAGGQPGALQYEWDFDADGQYDDAVGPTPTFSAAAIAGPRGLTVGLRVTDAALASASDTAVVIVAGAVAYVDDTAAGADYGTSWADAFRDLQSALAMSVPGQVIRVAQGTYKPTTGINRAQSFVLRSGVVLQGGYAGWGAADPSARDAARYVSTLSGDVGRPNDATDNSFHVVVGGGADATAVLDGFTVSGGNADGDHAYGYDQGGGVYNDRSSPTLSNCTFRANSARYGGAMYNDSSSPKLTDCTLVANSADYYGGGMYNDTSSPTLADCAFIANSTGHYGGGMCNAWSSPTLINCAFAANSAKNSGGGMYNESSSSPTLTNCILWANTASSASQVFTTGSGAPVVTYCDLQGGYSGAGNIDLDPQFVRNPSPGPDGKWRTADDDYGDVRLRQNSPCIDGGDNAAVPTGTTTDLAGNPRFVDVPGVADTGSGTPPIVDMGAYESPNPNLVVGGTDGPDEFSLGLSPDQSSIRIVAPGMSNTYSVLAITAITVSGAEGDDRLTVDFANGNPVPAGGVTFDGQGGSDGVCVVAPDNNATLTGEQVSVGTAAPIGSSNIEGTSFHLGTGKLTKCGSGTATVVGGSVYTGGTEVLGGTLLVGDAHALPTGGSLTIGAGATVVLPSGRSQAVVAERGNAVLQGPAGGGPWQADSGAGQVDRGAGQADSRPWQVDCRQWTVHSPLSTAYGPQSPCLPGPETAPARKSLADFSAGALSFAPAPRTAVAPNRTFETPVRSADLQTCKEVALLAAGQQAVKKKAPIQQAVDRALAALWP
jgi:autotransporter-associated beta strand protein